MRTGRATVDNPFFRLMPAWSQLSMVVLATVATVIASQAVISGAFSLTQQAVQLGFLPRVSIRHTSPRVMGQIYVPAVNWFLLAAVVGLVLGFRSSSALASAYGIAVTGTFATNTLLAFVIFRVVWRKPLWMIDRRSGTVPDHRADLLRRQPDQGRQRRLAAAGGRRDRLHDPHHLAIAVARSGPGDARGPGAGCASSSTG